MTHIFLTGEIQIGKSTVIRKTLSMLNVQYGGFRTYFGPDRANPDRCLYMSDAGLAPCYSEENVVSRFSAASIPEVYTERFDALGTLCISKARKASRLIIMDECGNLEEQALRLQNAILDTLDGDIPVIGVVKLSASGWVDKIRAHPKVRLITVVKDNRDDLPDQLVIDLRHYF